MRSGLFLASCLVALTGFVGAASAEDMDYPFVKPSLTARNHLVYDTQNNKAQPAAYGTTARTPAIPPKVLPPVTPAETPKGLLTETAIQVGAQFSRYTYQEADLGVYIRGLKYGLTFDASAPVYGQWFAKINGRFALGQDDYKSASGHSYDEPSNLFEARLLGGRDFLVSNQISVSPFLGVGYRLFYNDARGTTELNSKGYRRVSQYVYVPIGVNPRYLIDSTSRISLNFEYDQLVAGKQISHLGDAGYVYNSSLATNLQYGDVHNQQFAGFGLRGDVMYESKNWSVGPFFNYWNINQSKSSCTSIVTVGGSTGYSCGWIEPNNQTLEYGIQAKYKLY